jgi:hypothetical protein
MKKQGWLRPAKHSYVNTNVLTDQLKQMTVQLLLRIFFLVLLTGWIIDVHSQKVYPYTLADKTALANARKKAALMDQQMLTDKQAYALGMEYQRVYNKYKDTSMQLAVRCFEYFCWEENDYTFTTQQKSVAYKLGQVYEKGTGIKRDTMMAMTWYQLSTAAGIAKAKSLQQLFCGRPLVLQVGSEKIVNPQQATQMLHTGAILSLATSPSCKYTMKQIEGVALPIAEFMKERPDALLNLEYNVSSKWNSTHSLNVRQRVNMVMDQVVTYLVEKVGISHERIRKAGEPGGADLNGPQGYSYIEFQPTTYEQDFEKRRISIKGIYTFKDPNGHCSSSYLFLENGNYYVERGCENRSTISRGTFRASDDQIRLEPALRPALSYFVETKDTVGSWVRIVDMNNEPLYTFTLKMLVNPVLDTNSSLTLLQPDSLGLYKIPEADKVSVSFHREIAMIETSHILEQWAGLTKTRNTLFTFRFNYPSFCLRYPYITVSRDSAAYFFGNIPKSFDDSEGKRFKKQNK